MLIWFTDLWFLHINGLQVLQYLTVRTVGSVFTSFFLVLFFAPYIIKLFDSRNMEQIVRSDGPSSHLNKTGTPTMGGMIFIPAIVLATLLWCRLDNFYVWIVLLTLLCFGFIGLTDDGLKLFAGSHKGLSVRAKLFWQTSCATAISVALFVWGASPEITQLMLPFFKNVHPDLGYLFIPMSVLVIVGTCNAVNLTDGLDGLAIMPVVLIAAALGLIAYLAGNVEFSRYLYIPYISGSGELVIFCGSLVGAGLGFLWFNTYPAQVFMGDTGSLSLGASLGVMAVIVRHELVLFIMGGVFVIEAISVIVQVASYKLTGNRVFQMAPIHHHFELKGWPEPRVIVRFWIITLLLVLFGLATLKLR